MTLNTPSGNSYSSMIARAWSRYWNGLRRFHADRVGTVVLLFGLTLIPIMGFVGGAIDYANAYRTRTKIQNALDSAALAAGREVDNGSSEGNARQVAMDVFKANLGPNFPAGVSVNFNFDGTTVTADAGMAVDTYILGVLGIDKFDVGATASVTISGGTVEVALVLDNSGSMRGSRIAALKDAAKQLTQTLFQNDRTKSSVKIGVVPFAAAVNVGPRYANARWMDTGGQSSMHYENFDANTTRFALFNAMPGTSWEGCVEVRPSPHDVTDSDPVGGDSLFVPLFAPDEPDKGRRYNNSYLRDDGGSCGRPPRRETEEQAQEKTCKYDRARPSRRSGGPNYMCDPRPIQELTNTQGLVVSSIENMQASGMTNIMEGVMWGWRILSPGEPFTQGLPYEEKDNRKYMIVMTDGANTHTGTSTQNKSRYSAFGYAKNGRLTAPTSSRSRLVQAMNAKTLQGCTNAKDSNITVFTIAFNVNDRDTVDMLRQCASGSSRAYTIDNGAALIALFEAIADEINRLRITS